MSSSIVPKGSLVLVTGVTGFIGSATANELLKLGYRVRGTTRDASKAELLRKKFDQEYGSGKFEVLQVEDFAATNAYDAAIKDVTAVVHIATDGSFSNEPSVVINNTVEATLTVLRSAAATPSVKSVVLTSSRIAAYNQESGKTYNISVDTWFDEVVPMAWNAPADHPMKALLIYGASKVEGEKAAWKFIREEKPHFKFNAVLPDLVIGTAFNPAGVGSTHSAISGLFNGSPDFILMFAEVAGWYVDAVDVARIHVGALVEPDVKGERIWAAAGGGWTLNDILAIWRKAFPEHKFIADLTLPPQANISLPNQRGLELLKRQGHDGWIGLKEALLSNVEGL